MAFGNHAEMGSQSFDKVRPAATVDGNAPVQRSKKARMLNMSTSHRFDTGYALSAVMNGSRGDKQDKNHAIPLNGRSQVSMSESAKHGKFGD